VSLEDNIKAFKQILSGELDDIPEQCFYLKGGIEEVLEAAEKLKAEK
jgi:F-type H+-transporting ATPase subunit beta